tara:strand:- start:11747 stop:12238 length:492 start_codon:yes stop_codon:yes gene_type:complete
VTITKSCPDEITISLPDLYLQLTDELKVMRMRFDYDSIKIREYISECIIGKYLSIDGIKAMTTILDAEQISKDNIKLKYNKKLKFKTMSYSKKVDDLVKAVDKDAYIHKLNDSEFELRVEGYTKSYRFRIRKSTEAKDWKIVTNSLPLFVPILKANIYKGKFI